MKKTNKVLLLNSLAASRSFYTCLFSMFLTCSVFFPAHSMADSPAYLKKIDSIINAGEPPEGVVFEIINRDVLFLNWALPEVEKQSVRLRNKFPDLDIVVVSHGREMFSLTTA